MKRARRSVAARAAAASSVTRKSFRTVSAIVAGSRPIAAQCARRTAAFAVSVATSPDAFQRSAWRATIRSARRSPCPPRRSGSRAWTGFGAHAASRSR